MLLGAPWNAWPSSSSIFKRHQASCTFPDASQDQHDWSLWSSCDVPVQGHMPTITIQNCIYSTPRSWWVILQHNCCIDMVISRPAWLIIVIELRCPRTRTHADDHNSELYLFDTQIMMSYIAAQLLYWYGDLKTIMINHCDQAAMSPYKDTWCRRSHSRIHSDLVLLCGLQIQIPARRCRPLAFQRPMGRFL